MSRTLSWFSCGAASAIATKLIPDAVPVYCETSSEHPDNERFLADCEKWFERPIIKIHSDEFADTWDVWERRKYLAGISGAPCTIELKVAPRLAFQKPTDTHVFGYTADGPDAERADRLRRNYPELKILTPLIERGLTKNACIEMIARANIIPPPYLCFGISK